MSKRFVVAVLLASVVVTMSAAHVAQATCYYLSPPTLGSSATCAEAVVGSGPTYSYSVGVAYSRCPGAHLQVVAGGNSNNPAPFGYLPYADYGVAIC